jgi:hypothetical protein
MVLVLYQHMRNSLSAEGGLGSGENGSMISGVSSRSGVIEVVGDLLRTLERMGEDVPSDLVLIWSSILSLSSTWY